MRRARPSRADMVWNRSGTCDPSADAKASIASKDGAPAPRSIFLIHSSLRDVASASWPCVKPHAFLRARTLSPEQFR